MAESVQYYLERMIPELEGLEKKNIFSHVEIKSIIKKRTNFEYALQRRIKQKIDFLRAIEYEINLEDLRRKRVGRMGIADTLKGSNLQYSGARRIYNLFRRATIKFTGDLSLWLQYIDYAKRNKANNVLSSVFVQAIQYHPTNASLWIMAATWEHEHNANMAAARVLLQRALRLMPENRQLWHEYFRLELIYIEKIKLRRRVLGIDQQKNAEDIEPMDQDDDNTIQLPAVTGEDVEAWNKNEDDAATSKLKKMTHDEAAALEEANNPILQGLLATIIYDNAIKAIPKDIEFRKQFVSIYGEFSDTQKHIEHVYDTIRQDMMEDPAAAAFLATRHLGTLTLSDPAFIPALRQSVQEFEQALIRLPQPEMWLQYVQFLQNWHDVVSEPNLKSYLSKQLLKTFKVCHKQHHKMNVALFEAWTHHLVQVNNTEKADDVAAQGLEYYSNSVTLWIHRIQLAKDDPVEQKSLYGKALDVNSASLTLWTSYKDWILTHNKEEEADTLLWEGCTKATALLPSVSASSNDRNEIKDVLQSSYVTWAAETKGIERAREVYKKIVLHCYPTRAFFSKAIEVEAHHGQGDAQGQASVEYLYDRLTRLEEDKEESYISYLAYLYSQKKLQTANQVYLRAVKEVLNKEAFDLQVQKLKPSSSL